ncbi:MAG TPA: Bax inhibitor-1/YccA family protein [Actinomycetaceae bacterium]|nr:Bax inhibitor-1/YccA family protein [Actinomycetaceae bacterium]
MSNPVLTRAFNDQGAKTPAGYPVHPGHQPGQGRSAHTTQQPSSGYHYGYDQAPAGYPPQQQGYDAEAAYRMPSPTNADIGRMTVDDVVVKTGTLVGVVAVTAVAAAGLSSAQPQLVMPLWIGGLIGGLVFGLVNAFRREPSVPLIMTYALFEGAFLGAISFWANAWVPGVVPQAVFATFIVAAVCLFLYRSGLVKVTQRFRSVLRLALVSYLIFCLVNLAVVLFVPSGMFGIRSIEAGGIAIGLGIGFIAVIIASMSLIADFDDIEKGVRAGVPSRFAWTAAFGITVTLVWMYIEILRILLLLFAND